MVKLGIATFVVLWLGDAHICIASKLFHAFKVRSVRVGEGLGDG